MTSKPVVKVEHLGKRYKNFTGRRGRLLSALFSSPSGQTEEIWALNDVSFQIQAGESVAIIGRNGGGKSTLLEILSGTLTPTKGSVEVQGRVGALLELGAGFNPEFSGRDNAVLNALLLGLPRADVYSKFREIEDFAEIGDAIDRPLKTYSSGMIVRLAFAVQVIAKPDVLIVDEALSVGDFFFQQKCLAHIRALKQSGVTIIYVSHDMGSVRDLCSRVIYLNAGKVEYDGETFEGISRYFRDGAGKGDEMALAPSRTQADSSSPVESVPLGRIAKFIKESIWASNEIQKPEKIIGIAIYGEDGIPTTNFRLGSKMTVRVLFRPRARVPNHITIALQDRTGAVRTATGSSIRGLTGYLGPELGLFEATLTLLIEAGEYAIFCNLGLEAGKNRGLTLHEITNLGPISVGWDYENETAPFLGQVGLPVEMGFLCLEDIR